MCCYFLSLPACQLWCWQACVICLKSFTHILAWAFLPLKNSLISMNCLSKLRQTFDFWEEWQFRICLGLDSCTFIHILLCVLAELAIVSWYAVAILAVCSESTSIISNRVIMSWLLCIFYDWLYHGLFNCRDAFSSTAKIHISVCGELDSDLWCWKKIDVDYEVAKNHYAVTSFVDPDDLWMLGKKLELPARKKAEACNFLSLLMKTSMVPLFMISQMMDACSSWETNLVCKLLRKCGKQNEVKLHGVVNLCAYNE